MMQLLLMGACIPQMLIRKLAQNATQKLFGAGKKVFIQDQGAQNATCGSIRYTPSHNSS
jgi:hypothetical protein